MLGLTFNQGMRASRGDAAGFRAPWVRMLNIFESNRESNLWL
jgi:hypothetical protein